MEVLEMWRFDPRVPRGELNREIRRVFAGLGLDPEVHVHPGQDSQLVAVYRARRDGHGEFIGALYSTPLDWSAECEMYYLGFADEGPKVQWDILETTWPGRRFLRDAVAERDSLWRDAALRGEGARHDVTLESLRKEAAQV